MTPWTPQANELLQALELPSPEERRAFLDQVVGEDRELRAQVEALLGASERAGSFLEAPAVALGITTDIVEARAEAVGSMVGPYKLWQKLGEGGMGAVWVAEQQQPVKRRVALKVIKPGMDSAQVLRRFEAERQALALMDHTNIARVFDAGMTAAGRPFFVMELVKGVPITKYCDELHLPIDERLALFVPVCQAIQHAHQKGIIHRDIKPSNVLVCMQDGRPLPKVIDFGVVKALHGNLTDASLYTEIGQVVGTLEYMSPEQAELSALDIDTRADVYGLGALLYELLTGSPPLDRKRLAQAGLMEVLRLIKEEGPPRPSTRLSESKESLAGLAAQRRTLPGQLTREVRGELDWIVMRCLEKDRTRRYESASSLARDVERYLADEAVEACPPGKGYRLRKFARRNRKGLLVAGTFVVLLMAATAVSAWQAVRATKAEQEARKSAAVGNALFRLFQDDLLDPDELGEGGNGATTTRAGLERVARKVGTRLHEHPEAEALMLIIVGRGLLDLGEPARAMPLLVRAVELSRRTKGESHWDTVGAVCNLARAYREERRKDRAEELLVEALAHSRRDWGEQDVRTARLRYELGLSFATAGEHDKAEPLLREARAAYERAEGPDAFGAVCAVGALANSYFAQGKYRLAGPLCEEALAAERRRRGDNHPSTFLWLEQLGNVRHAEGRHAEAERLYREVLVGRRRVLGNEHAYVAVTLTFLGESLFRQQKYTEAAALLREGLTIYEKKVPDVYGRFSTQALLGAALLGENKYAEAEPLLKGGYEGMKQRQDKGPPATIRPTEALECLVRLCEATGKQDEAAKWRQELAAVPERRR